MAAARKTQNRYKKLIEKIFFDKYVARATELPFERGELESAAATLKVKLPKNLGDILYSFRYRAAMPDRILATQPEGKEWIIEGKGRAQYAFKLVRINRIAPREELLEIKIPNATPELIAAYALDDEQALLAVIRYNRLIDIFLGLTTYSLQNHLRTTVVGVGQIEIDELYVGLDKQGGHFVIPVQAKGGSDQISVVQTVQDIKACAEKFRGAKCRPVSVQFMADKLIAMFELTEVAGEVKVVEERHYRLVPAEALDKPPPASMEELGL